MEDVSHKRGKRANVLPIIALGQRTVSCLKFRSVAASVRSIILMVTGQKGKQRSVSYSHPGFCSDPSVHMGNAVAERKLMTCGG